MISLFQPVLGRDELEAIARVFDSNWVGRGERTARFESDFARHLGVAPKQVRSVSCCTEGLFQAIELLDLGPGDEVVLPTISFVGAANAIAARGARPVFCDVDPRSLNATARHIEEQLTDRTHAVMILHYGGVPCEMDEICDLLSRRGIPLIEDSGCSVSSHYHERRCGTFGEVGVWSFDAMKILVMGDGGMVYCRDPELAERLGRQIYLGLETASGLSSDAETRWWEFDISCFGRRAITNDIAAAIALVQLEKLPGFIERRRQVHDSYSSELRELEWLQLPPPIPDDVGSSYYMYWLQTEPRLRDQLARFLRDHGIYTTFRYHPLHRVALYGSSQSLPGSERAALSTLCIPIHHGLTDADVKQVVEQIHAFGGTL